MHKLISLFQFVSQFLLVWSCSHKPILFLVFLLGSSWFINLLKYAEGHGIPERSVHKQHYCSRCHCSCRFAVKFAFFSHNNFYQLNLKAYLYIMVPICTGVANHCWTFRHGVDIRVLLFGISDLCDQPLLTLKNSLF